MRLGCAAEVYHSARMSIPDNIVESEITLNLRVVVSTLGRGREPQIRTAPRDLR